MIPSTWLNIGRVIQTVRKGDLISIEVQGGFVRKPAPCAGLMIEDRNQITMFVPDELGVLKK